MRLYHIGVSLKEGLLLLNDFTNKRALVEPFMMALDKGDDYFEMLLIEARYVRAIMRKHRMREWSNYSKWATEAIFEQVRQMEFPDSSSRINGLFYYEDLAKCEQLYRMDYLKPGDADENVAIFEIEVEDTTPQRFDMSIYDAALDAIEERHDIRFARESARSYFSGHRSGNIVEEIISGKRATVIKKINIPE